MNVIKTELEILEHVVHGQQTMMHKQSLTY